MKKTEFICEFGVTVVCVIRDVIHIEQFAENTYQTSQGLRLFFADSWFGSMKAAFQVLKLSHHACFAVKTAHSRTQKNFLEDTMMDFS